jgi:signal transduction histidine kinase
MMAQVDEMMLLSTIKERASETLQGQAVDVDKAVEESVQQFAPEAKEKGLTLTREGDGAAKVWAWEDAVETVLEHLLSNAVKYTPSGGSVRVRVTHQAGEVAIDVIDNGIGIPPDQQDRLFHEFFRATNARQVGGGTGLGLSIVKAIVERLGGQISVASPPGQGTSVHVSLPLAA